jgi:hypothetical protein
MRMGKALKQYLDEAKPLSGDNIITVTDLKSEVIQFLTSYDQYSGYKSISFDFFNQKLKGLRMGEFSILTGETGSGKTTFLTQMSLDFLQQRVPTLWGSFEIKNDKLISLFLMQLAKKNLRQAPVKEIEFYAEMLEKFPLYMLKFHGAQNLEEIINTMNYAVYNFDIQNIVLDNLQFMVGAPSAGKQLNKFDYQDEIIQKMRKFATEKNIHLTLVIHPRKTDEALKISSIFGTAKASQEADNIYIIQAYKGIRIIEIAKNRFDGATGKVALAFDTEACRYFELEESEFSDYTRGILSVQEIIGERMKLHGKVEFKHKEYAGVNYDKLVEFNKNYQEKLSELKQLSDNLIKEKKEDNFKVEIKLKSFENKKNSDENFDDKKNIKEHNNNEKNDISKKEQTQNLNDSVKIKAKNIEKINQKEFEANSELIIETENEKDFSFQEENRMKEEKEAIANSKQKPDETISQKVDESEKIEELVAKKKKASAKKSSSLSEINNQITEKIEGKKRISKNSRKLMDIELKENSSGDSHKNATEKEKEKEKQDGKSSSFAYRAKSSEKPINSDISELSEIDLIIMNSDLIYDERSLFSEVNESLKTIIKEEVLIAENKILIIKPNEINYKNKNNIKTAKTENLDNLQELNKAAIAIESNSSEKPKRERKRKESTKSKKEELGKITKENANTQKELDSIESEEKKINENVNKEIKANEEPKESLKFELNEEEKGKVFNFEIYDQEIEKATINTILNEQVNIFPEISYVESFHTQITQEKAFANDWKNRRKNEVTNKYTLFQPIKYSSKN